LRFIQLPFGELFQNEDVKKIVQQDISE
jgi:hypothetical protein